MNSDEQVEKSTLEIAQAALESNTQGIANTKEKVKRENPFGLLSQLCLIRELEDPYAYSRTVKSCIVFIYAFAGMVPAMGSAVFYPAVKDIQRDLHTSASVINLSIGFYMVSLGLFPLWWSHLSEIYGRRGIYIISFFLFSVFNVGCARAPNITVLIVLRILAGGAAACSQSVGAGGIGDIYVPAERGSANGYFYLGPLCGPLVAPIIAGALDEHWGWRSTQYFLIALGGSAFILILFLLPETLHREVCKDGKETHSVTSFVFGPFKSFKLLAYPSFVFAITYNSFTYFLLYLINNTIPYEFGNSPYNFSAIIVGLLYLPNGAAFITGSLFGGKWSDRIIERHLKNNNGVLIPEARLAENMICAGISTCAGCLLFGWTIWAKEYWIVPIIGTVLFGFGSLIIFTTTLTFLVDSMPKQRTAIVSVNTFIRCISAAIGTFIAVPLIDAIGTGILYSIVTGIGICFVALQFYVKKVRHNYISLREFTLIVLRILERRTLEI
ncbi:major facilitator superfamily domain-containing protein [Dipodascopsis uninucleata]